MKTRIHSLFLSSLKLTPHMLIASAAVILSADPASAGPIVYTVSINYNDFTSQFGTMDLTTGAFKQIGSVISDALGGLIPVSNGKLLSLSLSGNLDSINPANGVVSVIGATGLGNLAGVTAELNGTVYATDLYNNFYKVNTTTGLASLIGATGLPICPSLISPVEVSDEALFTANGKLYVTFDGLNLANSTVVDPPLLYEINPVTGVAAVIGPTALGIQAVSQINGTVYGFDFSPEGPNSLVSLNLANGNTTFLNNYASSPVTGDVNAFAVTGVSSTPEPASFALIIGGLLVIGASRKRAFRAKETIMK